jgi:peptidoglycan/xylan/chitin deacetylase (PgdA/CDA1 family)
MPATVGAATSRGNVKRRLRQSAATALDRALRLSGLRVGIALVYHEIRDESAGDPGSRPAPIVPTATAATFQEQVRYLGANYRLVPAGELRAASLARRRGEPFPLAITFDDDLRSHVDVALPILVGAGAPATFFLTGASLNGPASFWWERLDRALDAGAGAEMLGTDDPGHAVATVAALPASERRELSAALLERVGGEEEGSGLRSSQVAALAAAGCEIGFHTREHERLTGLDDAALERSMRDGSDELERAAAMRLRSVAYPFGDADDRVAGAARNAGFESGFTTRGTAVRADADPFLMGRLYPSEASIAHLASQLSFATWRAARGR